ncbi:hypothetical protein F511_07178 [Dorcoceras hygrometricum]|nr:hypothetical protein F511_07178 [Dorcoceras hygrometricum]
MTDVFRLTKVMNGPNADRIFLMCKVKEEQTKTSWLKTNQVGINLQEKIVKEDHSFEDDEDQLERDQLDKSKLEELLKNGCKQEEKERALNRTELCWDRSGSAPRQAAEEQKFSGMRSIRLIKTDLRINIHRIRQSGPRPDSRLLRQTALEVLTRSARSDSPRKTRPERNSGEVGRRRRRASHLSGTCAWLQPVFQEPGASRLIAVDSSIRSTTRLEAPSSDCTRSPDEISTIGFSTKSHFPKSSSRAQHIELSIRVGVFESSTCVTLNGSGIQLAVGPQPLWLRNHNSGPSQRIMVKRLATSPHDPLGITDSACKNQSVVVSVLYGPFNPYIPIRSTTIGKSRVARDPIAMHTSWRSNSDIASVTSIGHPRMSASGESSTTMHRLLHASGSHPIPTPGDPK